MVFYNCEKCGKKFTTKSNYNVHIKRKTPCVSTIENKIEISIGETNTNMKFIDLCCGIGGFHQALSNMGMECVMASDITPTEKKNETKIL